MSNIQNYITRQNYEEWFIDYLDGHMNPERKQLLFEFLNHNADLKAELESMRSFVMPVAESVSFPDKFRLFMMANTNLELPESDYLLIKQMEEGLSENEQARLNELTQQYPGLKKDELLYNQTRLAPTAIDYPRKKTLVHRRAGWIWPASQAVAAAILIGVLLIPGKQAFEVESPRQEFTAFTQPVTPIESVDKPIVKENPKEVEVSAAMQQPVEEEVLAIRNQAKHAPEQPEINSFDKVAPAPIIPNRAILLETDPIQVDAYEEGLAMMIPTYIDNQRLQDVSTVVVEEPMVASSSVLERGTEFISSLAQKELGFRKIYDQEGKVVAVNVKSGDFEVSQRLPRLFRR